MFFADIALSNEPVALFIDIKGEDLIEDKADVETACELFGVRVKHRLLEKQTDVETLKENLIADNIDVLIITGRSLRILNEEFISFLMRLDRKVKVLILNLSPAVENTYLNKWSNGIITGCKQYDGSFPGRSLEIKKNDEITLELGGIKYPLLKDVQTVSGFDLINRGRAIPIIDIIDQNNKLLSQSFIKVDLDDKSIFFSAAMTDKNNQIDSFIKLAPAVIFLKYAFSDRVWHSNHDYANLTIDDPWLREPYGYLNFSDLCREAIENRFHVSIGFIPWNYKRSEDEVVSVFQKFEDYLSIAIHGNNHDFSEFCNSRDIFTDRKNIQQALKRMDTFNKLTGLKYDRVMIFPRGQFVADTLNVLKEQNFLMTINATMPKGYNSFVSDVDNIRGITLEYENFQVVMRKMIDHLKDHNVVDFQTKLFISMRLFLDLPVFFATHHDFFKNGSDTFNKIAEIVNKTQPNVKWTSLGNIARGFYLQRMVDRQIIEIKAFTNELTVKNLNPYPVKYKIHKQENFVVPILKVLIDGVETQYRRNDKSLEIDLWIGPFIESNIKIIYMAQDTPEVNVTNPSVQSSIVRALSDFRDIRLSNPFGQIVTSLFYGYGGVKTLGVVIILIVLLLVCSIIFMIFKKNENFKE